jgi:hypothetical protein
LRANGSRESAPDDRLREAIHLRRQHKYWIASSLTLLAMTISRHSGAMRSIEPGIQGFPDVQLHI